MEQRNIKKNEFFGLSTFQFLAYFRRLIVYTFLAIYLKSLGLSNFEVSLMPTIGMIANASTQSFLWGRLIDKFRNPKAFIVIGEIIAGLTHVIMVLSYQVFLISNEKILAGYIIILTLGITEIFWSMSNVGWSALIANLTQADERKKIMAQLSVIGGFGGIFGAQVGGLLYLRGAGFDSGVIIYIAAIVMVLSAILVLLLVQQRPYVDEILQEDQPNGIIRITEKFSELPSSTKKTFIWFIIALVFINFGRNSIYILTGIYLTDSSSFSASDESIALYSNVSSIATMIIGIMVGTIIAKVDDNKVLLSGSLFAFIGIIWLILAPTFDFVLLAGFLFGASNVIIESSAYAIVSKIIPESFRGRLFGIFNATFFLSWGIGATFITGPVADFMVSIGSTNSIAYKTSFLCASFLVGIGILLLLFSFKLVNSLMQEKHIDIHY